MRRLVLFLVLLLTGCASSRSIPTPTPKPVLLIAPKPTDTPIPTADGWSIVRLTVAAAAPTQTAYAINATASAAPPRVPTNVAVCNIKGNVNSRGERFYHCPNFPQYSRTNVIASEGDRWFCSPEEAEAAGFVSGDKTRSCHQ